MTWTLRDLPAASCKWGLDDPGLGQMDSMRLCGEPEAFDGCPWCKAHLARAYPKPSREQRASWRLAQARADAFRLRMTEAAMKDEAAPDDAMPDERTELVA